MKNALILIIGLPGSGKSFAASVIKKRFHARVFETGDVIREEIKRRGWKYTPKNDAKVRDWFHSGREHMIVESQVVFRSTSFLFLYSIKCISYLNTLANRIEYKM
jgi:adenylate kinase family enzyme